VNIPNRDKIFYEKVDGNKVKITWEIHSVDVSRSDYVGLYHPEDANNYYLTYKYVDKVANSLTFDLSNQLPGTYEFRYHSKRQSRSRDLARTPTLKLENESKVASVLKDNEMEVTWEITTPKITSYDWIGLFKEGAVDTGYITWKYVDLKKNCINFKLKENGRYQARYFSWYKGRKESLVSGNVVELKQ